MIGGANQSGDSSSGDAGRDASKQHLDTAGADVGRRSQACALSGLPKVSSAASDTGERAFDADREATTHGLHRRRRKSGSVHKE
jgi:hypothetical protein